MKKILLILISCCLSYSCDCDGDCNGFDFNAPIYKWYLFPSDIPELKFYNNENETLILEQQSSEVTEPRTIEKECFDLVTSGSCDEFILNKYRIDNNNRVEIINEINIYEFSTSEVMSRINFAYNLDTSIYFENNEVRNTNTTDFSLQTIDTINLNDKIWTDVISIKVNNSFLELNDYNGITQIWIQKNEGLIAFQIDGIIWTKDI